MCMSHLFVDGLGSCLLVSDILARHLKKAWEWGMESEGVGVGKAGRGGVFAGDVVPADPDPDPDPADPRKLAWARL